MAFISPTQVVDGTTMDASDINNPINTITAALNGNLDDSNIKASAGISTTKLAADAGITSGMIGPGAIALGYAETTSGQGNITTEVDLTGLSVAVTVPTGGRKIRITASLVLDNSATTDTSLAYIKEGSTYLQSRQTWQASGYKPLQFSWVGTPTAGPHTYKLSLQRASGTGTTSSNAGVVGPLALGAAYILVEAL